VLPLIPVVLQVCSRCGFGGLLMQCLTCYREDHVYCAGYNWPPDGEYTCRECGGTPPPTQQGGAGFTCAICMEEKPEDAHVDFSSCSHTEKICGECVFKHVCERSSTCPLCRVEVTELVHAATGRRLPVEQVRPELEEPTAEEVLAAGASDEDEDEGFEDEDEDEDEGQVIRVGARGNRRACLDSDEDEVMESDPKLSETYAAFVADFAHRWDEELPQPAERAVEHVIVRWRRLVDSTCGKKHGRGAIKDIGLSEEKVAKFKKMNGVSS
jgi:hypothetical protein